MPRAMSTPVPSSHEPDPDATLPVASIAARLPLAGEPPAPDLSGLRLGAWTLVRKIGQGGMGEVWLAERSDGLYQAQAAIKLLRSDVPPEYLAERFARERAVLARLDHPAIARLLDAGVDQGRAFLVLEYVQGLSLVAHVRQHCPDVASRVRLVMQVAEAVDHAHARLVVHRDLKPANVLVLPDGTPKLLDFGIAGLLEDDEPGDGQLTRLTGRRITPAYAAPEQITGEPVGVTADVFSLGVMLYQLLSGELPFAAESSSRVAAEHAVLHREAPRLGSTLARARPPDAPADPARVRGDLEAIVAKALRKRPSERYSSVRVLIDDLQRWLTLRPVSVRRDDWRHRTGLWVQRHALAAGSAAVLALALTGGLAASLWQWQRAQAAARTSEEVTRYLGDLLQSASPERNQGRVPTVLQLLETSRQDVNQRFAHDGATRERLLEVLGKTYRALNRSDLALPLVRERIALAQQLYGPQAERTLRAQVSLQDILAQRESFDEVLALGESLRSLVPRRLGAQSDEHRSVLYALAYANTRLGRLAAAEALLQEAGRVTEAMYPQGHFERLFHNNHLQVYLTTAGRLREALDVMKQTQPFWDGIPADKTAHRHVLERNTLAVRIRLGDYAGLVDQGQDLLRRVDALMGPGSDQANGLRAELARALIETGRFEEALQQRQAVLDTPPAVQARSAAMALPLRAHALLAAALARPAAGALHREQLRSLLADLAAARDSIGLMAADGLFSLLRAALVLGDLEQAGQVAEVLRQWPRLQANAFQLSRFGQLQAQLARARGDLAGSRDALQARVQSMARLGGQPTPPAWSVQLDLACTLVDLGDADAAAALARAASLRPPGMPEGVPLDLLQAWLQRRLASGRDDDDAARAAWRQLAARVGRAGSTDRHAVVSAALL